MARWIEQTLRVNDSATIVIQEDGVWIAQGLGESAYSPARFIPTSRDDANGMAIALRLAAKRLEDIGKGMR